MPSQPGKSFDALIFDCDGVLVDSEVLAIKGERIALEALGLVYSPQDYVRKFVGLHDRAFFDALREDYHHTHGREVPDDFEDRILEGRRREREWRRPLACRSHSASETKAALRQA